MMSDLLKRLKANGVVGAGGAGFPTWKKYETRAEQVLVNAAECEPLLHKDKEMLKAYATEMVEGLRLACEQVGAREGVIGIKEKYQDVISALTPKLLPNMRIHPLGDFYPAGDEFILVYEITRKVIPPGGLPLEVGAVVSNVETLVNVATDKPVTHKYLTIAGAVDKPCTVRVPIGTSLRDLLRLAGAAPIADFGALTGGIMMGRLADDLDEPVTRTTGGLIILPEGHPVLRRYRRTMTEVNRIGRSACDQCSFCTEFCPRYLLGHPIEPHRAMRALGFVMDREPQVIGTLFCCECNLCTMIACPEDLDPKNVCTQNKRRLMQEKARWPGNRDDVHPHGMFDGRRVPVKRLINKLDLREFRNEGPMVELSGEPERVAIPMKMHVGAPAKPCVAKGDRVRVGDTIGRMADGALGVDVHASVDGTVEESGDARIVIRRS
jgi:Na+-translocating ferredoxin:NAD+ oxidoreductase RnfC subunit